MSIDLPGYLDSHFGYAEPSPRWTGRLLATALCLLGLLLSGCSEVDEQAVMHQADQQIADGDYRAAVIELKKVLQQNPSNTEARFLLGTLFLRLEDGAKAERTLKKALQSGASPAQVLVPLGQALLLQSRFEDLLAELPADEAQDNELRAEVLALHGNAQLGLADPSTAEESFQAALTLQPDSVSALEGLVRIEADRGDLDAATARLTKALALAPDNAALWLLKGTIALSQADNDTALAAFDKALDLAISARQVRKELEARLRRAQALQITGDAQAAQNEVDTVLEKSPDLPMAHYVNASIAYAAEDYGRAELELREALRLTSDYPPALYLLSATEYAKADYTQAADLLDRYLAARPTDARARVLLAQARLRLGEPAEALEALPLEEAQGGQESEQSLQLALRGRAQLALGDASAAAEAFQAALELQPDLAPALEGLARIGAAQGDTNAVAARVTKALERTPEDAGLWLVEGDIARGKKDNAAALAAYDKAVDAAVAARQIDQELEARLRRAQVLLITGDTEAAQKEVDSVLERDPDLPLAHYVKAAIAYAAKDYDRAEAGLREVLLLTPAHAPSLFLLGATQYAKADYAQAHDLLVDYLAEHPADVRARKLLASARLRLGEPADALAVLAPLEAQADQDPELLLLLGESAERSQQADLALEYYRRAQKIRPDDVGIRIGLARVRLQKGDYDDAIGELGALQDADDPRIQALVIEAQLRKGDLAAARASVRDMQDRSPDSPRVGMLAGRVEVQAGDLEAAERLFREAIKLDADYLPPMIALGQMKLKAGELDQAEQWFRMAEDRHPDNTDALMGLAKVANARGDTDKALADAQRALQTNENALAPRLLLARYYLGKGDSEQAIEVLQDVRGRGSDPQFLALLGLAHKQAGNTEQALLSYQQLLDRAPKSEPLMLEIAALESKLGRQNAARRVLKNALELNPDSSPARALLAWVEARAGNPDLGLRLAEETQQRQPESPLGYKVAGDIQADQGDDASAIASYREAAKRQPSRELVAKQHKVLVRSGDQSAAQELLVQWLKETPQDAEVRLLLAIDYQTLGRTAEAIREYEEILKQRPKQAVALNNLAPLIFPTDRTQGLDYARRAVELAPNNPSIQDTYGWLLVESERPEEGIGHLRQALEVFDHPSIRYHLAVALVATGSAEAARRELDAALESEKPFDEREAARSLLDGLGEKESP